MLVDVVLSLVISNTILYSQKSVLMFFYLLLGFV